MTPGQIEAKDYLRYLQAKKTFRKIKDCARVAGVLEVYLSPIVEKFLKIVREKEYPSKGVGMTSSGEAADLLVHLTEELQEEISMHEQAK